jgi:hypothetical protein
MGFLDMSLFVRITESSKIWVSMFHSSAVQGSTNHTKYTSRQLTWSWGAK